MRIMRKYQLMLALGIVGLSLLSIAKGEASDPFIAGVKPYQRPENAPVITQVYKDQAWYMRALTGVSQPYPYSLRFLDDQGNWYTPFSRPGMTGYYDIRGWHQ